MTTKTSPDLSVEGTLRSLEQVVDDLERGEPELSSALAKYEQGVRLLGRCQAELERAERSVALLTGVDAAGNPVTAPFDAAATATVTVAPPERAPAPAPRKRPAPRKAAEGDDVVIPF